MALLKNRARRLLAHPFFPIGVIILVNLVIGVLVVTNYGESWDEQTRYNYANTVLEAYRGDIKGARGQAAYLMMARLGSQALRSVWSSLRPMEAWHFMHFLSFQMGLVFLYLICRQFVGQWASVGAVLLFNTQPLLWGHAWINPKDIPFMAFFLGSVALGLSMADSLISKPSTETSRQIGDLGGLAGQLGDEWHTAHPGKRRLFVGLIALSVGILVALVLARQPLQALIANLITQAYQADPSSAIGWVFSRLTENVKAVPLQRYVQKSPYVYSRMVGAYAAFALLFDLVLAAWSFPKARGWTWSNWALPLARSLPSYAANKRVLVAGLFLGLCASIRVLGPASGLMVAAYFLYKAGRKAIPGLIVYAAVAAVVLYATWPGLWTSPVQSYLESISKASDFPWDGKVMFGSVDYSIDDLPRSYLPVLLSLQFTETAIAMFLIGLFFAVRGILKEKTGWEKPVLMALWFFLPILAVVIRHPTQYDNFRHFLFITPPIFIFAGIGLQAIFTRFKSAWLVALILSILVLPNIYWDLKLHPYQYIYYNSLAGNLNGAFRRYEMDYWATSYREATLYLDAFAPPGSRVVVWGADHIVKSYARADLNISDYRKATGPQDFAIISTRHDKDLSLYSGAPVLFQVSRDGAIFTVVKRLNPQDSP